MKLRTILAAPVALAAAAVVLGPAGTAHADVTSSGSPTAGGFQVSISYTGSAAPGGGRGGGGGASVPAKCWWEPFQSDGFSDPNDPQAVKDWWEKTMPTINGSFTVGRVPYGDAELYDQAIAAAARGEKLTFYRAVCRDWDDIFEFAPEVYDIPPPYSDGRGLPRTVAFFAPGEVPAPTVDPRVLAEAAFRDMVLVEPALERNPKIGAGIAATLVGLPTWFWVVDPAAVGPGGERDIRATVDGPGGAWAQVVARTQRMTISSGGAGAGTCSVEQAVVPYRPGADEAGACTLNFDRSSVGSPGGWTVTSQVAWQGTFTSSTGEGGDDLGVRTAQAQVQVPVAESQAVVGEVG